MNDTEDGKLIVKRRVELKLEQKKKPQLLVTQTNGLDSITPSYRRPTTQQMSGTNLSPKELYDGSPSSEETGDEQYLSPEDLYNSSPDGDESGQGNGSAEPTFGQGIGGDNPDPEKDGRNEETKTLEENALKDNGQHAEEDPKNAGDQNSLPKESTEEPTQKPADAASKTPESVPSSNKETVKKPSVRERTREAWNKTKQKSREFANKTRDKLSRDSLKKAFSKEGMQAAGAAIKAGAAAAWEAITAFVAAFLPEILLVLAIIAGIAILVYFLHHNDPKTGKTINEPTSPITDKNWIQKLRLYAGDKNVTGEMSDQLKNDLNAAITELNTDPSISQACKDKVTILQKDVNMIQPGTNNNTLANSLTTDIKNTISSCALGQPGQFDGFISFEGKVKTDSPNIIKPGGKPGKSSACDTDKFGCHYDIFRPKTPELATGIVAGAFQKNGAAELPYLGTGTPVSYGAKGGPSQCPALIYFAAISAKVPDYSTSEAGLKRSSGIQYIPSKGANTQEAALQYGDIVHFNPPYSFNRTGNGHWAIVY